MAKKPSPESHLIFPSGATVGELKKRARWLVKHEELTQAQALDALAKENGLDMLWSRAIKRLKATQRIPAASPAPPALSADEVTRALLANFPAAEGPNAVFIATAERLMSELIPALLELQAHGVPFGIPVINEHLQPDAFARLAFDDRVSKTTRERLHDFMKTLHWRDEARAAIEGERSASASRALDSYYQQFGYAKSYWGFVILSLHNVSQQRSRVRMTSDAKAADRLAIIRRRGSPANNERTSFPAVCDLIRLGQQVRASIIEMYAQDGYIVFGGRPSAPRARISGGQITLSNTPSKPADVQRLIDELELSLPGAGEEWPLSEGTVALVSVIGDEERRPYAAIQFVKESAMAASEPRLPPLRKEQKGREAAPL